MKKKFNRSFIIQPKQRDRKQENAFQEFNFDKNLRREFKTKKYRRVIPDNFLKDKKQEIKNGLIKEAA